MMTRSRWLALRLALFAGLAWFYVAGATEHARTVNTDKSRSDQSGYLWDAESVYLNRHGEHLLIGDRNRMPVYAGYLSLFYKPTMSDPEFFEVAKVWNIRLSLVILAVFGVIFARYLPPLVSTNLLFVIAFGYFVFRAGYSQSELLLFFFLFLAFLAACHLLQRRGVVQSLILGAVTGTLIAIAHLTKAALLPFVAIVAAVCGASAVAELARQPRVAWSRALAGALLVGCFLAVMYPYASTSKRVFGQYFYNVNSTFYVWYDTWALASVGPYAHGDNVGWPKMPDAELMTMRKYWRRHTVGEIANRLALGFERIVERGYVTFWYLKYVLMYILFAAALIARNRRAFGQMVREHVWPFTFMVVYAVVYLFAIAFYDPTANTWTPRLVQAHLAPLLFVLSCFFAREPFSETRWNVGGTAVTPLHFHLLVFVTMALDLTFTIWPRLMTTFGGT